jgi:hypothetical protein
VDRESLCITCKICRVCQNCIYTSYMTVYLVISLPKTPYIHRIYIWLRPTLNICNTGNACSCAASEIKREGTHIGLMTMHCTAHFLEPLIEVCVERLIYPPHSCWWCCLAPKQSMVRSQSSYVSQQTPWLSGFLRLGAGTESIAFCFLDAHDSRLNVKKLAMKWEYTSIRFSGTRNRNSCNVRLQN